MHRVQLHYTLRRDASDALVRHPLIDLLQAVDALSSQMRALYVTGEESGAQIALRSRRLGLAGAKVRVLAEIHLEKIVAAIEAYRTAPTPNLILLEAGGDRAKLHGELDELAQFALEGIRNGDFVIMIGRETMEQTLRERAAKLARGECPIELQHMGLG